MDFFYNNISQNGQFVLTDLKKESFYNNLKIGDCYKIIWAKRDRVFLGLDGYRVHLNKGQLLFCTPLNRLQVSEETDAAICYVFNREFYCVRDHDSEVACNGFLFYGSSSPVVISLTEKEDSSFDLLYRFFIEEFNTKDKIQGEMLRVLLKRLLLKSVRIARRTMEDSGMPQSKLDIIRQFNLVLEMHFRTKHKVSEYADLLNIGSKSLSNLFLNYHNKSPLKVIGERIILEAQRLLQYSNKSTKEIAFELGFEEASHFSKFFKKNTGLSPKSYKETLKNELDYSHN